MQKKQIIQFVVLIMAVILMASAYFGIRTYNKKQEDKAQREEAAAVITLTSFEPDAVTAVSYDYDGSRYEFVKEDGKWKEASQSDLILDQDLFSDFLKSAGAIKAASEVNAEEDPAYGFDQPSRTVTITTTNGTSSLLFGAKNDLMDQYYVKTSESSRIYLADTSVYSIFDRKPEEFEAEETDADTNTDAGVDEETDADTNTDAGADEETDADTNTDAGADADTGTDKGADTDTDAGADTGTDTE